jgi:molybdate transport system ATP-binding protein
MTIALRDVALPLAHFELQVSVEMTSSATALYGPSGSGKTSLIETIAGLRKPARGTVVVHGKTVFDGEAGIDVPARERRIGYVPQDDALFPHMPVRRNIQYGSRHEKGHHPGFVHVVSVLEIGHLLDRGVRDLSGGERKRVALARALLSNPEVLLLDEPLAGVDFELRNRVLDYLLRVHRDFPIPLVYVTHSREEAAVVCDEIVKMERGRVVGKEELKIEN